MVAGKKSMRSGREKNCERTISTSAPHYFLSPLSRSLEQAILGQSFSRGHYPSICQPPEGVYLINIRTDNAINFHGTERGEI